MSKTKPIYIIGSTPIAYYLAAKISEAEQDVIIVADKQTNYDIESHGFTLKEDYCLHKSKFKIKTSFWIKEEPELVIWATSNRETNALTTAISPNKTTQSPILCFTNLKNKDFLEIYFKQPLIPAYFEGFVQKENYSISLLGRAPQITIDENVAKNKRLSLENTLKNCKLNYQFTSDSELCFWSHSLPHAIASILTTSENQNLSQILKNKKLREKLQICVEEAVSIANIPELSSDDIIKKLHTYPINYTFPLQQKGKKHAYHEIEYISSLLTANSYRNKTPVLKNELEKIYNIILI